MSQSTTSFSPAKIAATSAAVAAAALASYAVYFDYRRRNDPAFRKSLALQRKKVAQLEDIRTQGSKLEAKAALQRALALIKAEPLPSTVEAREGYFMEQISTGEQLSARGEDFYIPAAISLYKALRVYPTPHELLLIYQRTQPAGVLELLMQLIALDLDANPSTQAKEDEEP